MARQSEQLEHEAEAARDELAFSLEELRARMTPGEIVDEVVEYARETPAADFMRNLARDVRESPLPLLVIFAGIAWAAIASAGCPSQSHGPGTNYKTDGCRRSSPGASSRRAARMGSRFRPRASRVGHGHGRGAIRRRRNP